MPQLRGNETILGINIIGCKLRKNDESREAIKEFIDQGLVV
jgi:hypothetical protein